LTAELPVLAGESNQRGTRKGSEEGTREWLLARLRDILEIAMHRVTNPKTGAQDRIKWSRIVIAAGQALNGILRDVEIDALKQQINELRTLTLERLGEDEQGEDQGDQAGTSETEASD
jgi:hypothetical protein